MFHMDVVFKYKTKKLLFLKKMTKLRFISKGSECLCEKKRYKYRKKQVTGKSGKHLLACL